MVSNLGMASNQGAVDGLEEAHWVKKVIAVVWTVVEHIERPQHFKEEKHH